LETHFDEFNLCPEEEGVQTPAQILIPEEDENHQQQDDAEQKPEYPEGETFSRLGGRLRGKQAGQK